MLFVGPLGFQHRTIGDIPCTSPFFSNCFAGAREREEYRWLSDRGNTREGCVRAYILQHPGMINHDLTIANLLAVNVCLNKWKEDYVQTYREVDLIFEKEGIYYLVETKRDRKYKQGYRQLFHIMECFKSDFEKNRVIYKDFARSYVLL